LATRWNRSRMLRAWEHLSRITFKWEARHLKVNGEEPIMRRKVLGTNKEGVCVTICSS
jgi:hypothetical protein